MIKSNSGMNIFLPIYESAFDSLIVHRHQDSGYFLDVYETGLSKAKNSFMRRNCA